MMSARARRACLAVAGLVAVVSAAPAQTPPADRLDSDDSEHLKDLLQEQPDRDLGRTSEVEWTLSWYGQWNDGLVERHVTRTTGDTVLQSNFGDQDGDHREKFRLEGAEQAKLSGDGPLARAMFSTAPSSNASPEEAESLRTDPGRFSGTYSSLIYDGKVWHPNNLSPKKPAVTGSVESIGKAKQNLLVDFSAIGFAAGPHVDRNVVGLAPWDIEGLESAALERYRSGGLEVVVAEYNNRRVEWYLDPEQDGLPVEAMLFRHDTLALRSETDYEEVDGRRFPSSVRFYIGSDAEPYRVLDVQKATFDKPWHVQDIAPADIGIVFGTQLMSSEADGYMYRWDGTDLIGASEYSDLVELYGVQPDPRFVELLYVGTGMTAAEWIAWTEFTMAWRRKAYFEEHGTRPWLDDVVFLKPGERDEWDVYVEKFIAEHKLKGDAVKRAKDILQRSKKLRDARLRKDAPKIKQAKRENNKKKLAYYEGITKLIFDKVLVRSLNRLIPKTAGKTKAAKVAGKG